ncbi:MAG: hypothetical protein LBN36_01420 [Clostridiales Family XIII bacterium]|jgi:hypothetical protein|nr:hypothetical protein [Clostridiales Family XIII bacterium]
MAVEKQQVLYDAPGYLNRPDQPWYVTVEGDSIVARWKWMDAIFFAPHEVNNEVRDYTFTVTLKDNYKWKEVDRSEESSSGANFSNGQLSFGGSKNTFKGKQSGKSVQFGIGADRGSGAVGLVGFKFDTEAVKAPIRAFLSSAGWKKAGLFG